MATRNSKAARVSKSRKGLSVAARTRNQADTIVKILWPVAIAMHTMKGRRKTVLDVHACGAFDVLHSAMIHFLRAVEMQDPTIGSFEKK